MMPRFVGTIFAECECGELGQAQITDAHPIDELTGWLDGWSDNGMTCPKCLSESARIESEINAVYLS